ncbi:MAG: hypothetical protein AMDU4_FER2C00073G0007 [Ferroplasma sp. Type II]|nr:MAG: hypothetical protein AMDU4_FER2C00073G0007 [Ferroplasma sp. Type II]
MLIKIITEVLEYVFNSYGKVPVEGKESGSIGMKPLHSKD